MLTTALRCRECKKEYPKQALHVCEDCFGPLDFFEARKLPFVVAINAFDGIVRHNADEVREALQLGQDVPVMVIDARDRESAKQSLIAVVEHALRTWTATAPAAH